jgi:hypothetical protein
MNWHPTPTGRWVASLPAHGGFLTLHAWVNGSWAVTRGQAQHKWGDPFVTGSRDGLPEAKDLNGAMRLAEQAARAQAEKEGTARYAPTTLFE